MKRKWSLLVDRNEKSLLQGEYKKKWCGLDLADWLERLTANAAVATVMGSISASSDTVESEGRQMKQCWISYIKRKIQKNPHLKKRKKYGPLLLSRQGECTEQETKAPAQEQEKVDDLRKIIDVDLVIGVKVGWQAP